MGGADVFTTAERCWEVGVFPRGPPGAGADPVGCQAPVPSQPKSWAPGDRGAGAAGAAGLLAAGAGDGIPAPQSEACRSRLARALHRLLLVPERGESLFHPSLFSLPPTWAAPRCSSSAFAGHRPQTTWVFFRRNSARSQAAPREPGIPSATHGTPFVPPSHPGRWGSACTRTSESVCILPSQVEGPLPASSFS